MTDHRDEIVPIFRVADAEATAAWYGRMGFVVEHRHRFEPDLPLYVIMERNGAHLHLSEHLGDAPKRSLAYLWVDDIDVVATAYAVNIEDAPWARETTLVDPDGNTLRIGQPNSTEG